MQWHCSNYITSLSFKTFPPPKKSNVFHLAYLSQQSSALNTLISVVLVNVSRTSSSSRPRVSSKKGLQSVNTKKNERRPIQKKQLVSWRADRKHSQGWSEVKMSLGKGTTALQCMSTDICDTTCTGYYSNFTHETCFSIGKKSRQKCSRWNCPMSLCF